MIVSEINVSAGNVAPLVKIISTMSGVSRPVSISLGEDESGKLYDNDSLNTYLDKRISINSGFIVRGERGVFVFSPNYSGTWKVSIYEVEQSDALYLINGAAEVSADFAFACSEDELNDQNRIVMSLPYGQDEAWVGRDFKRYLPGVYWLNMVPESRIIDLNGLRKISITNQDIQLKIVNDRVIIMTSKSPSDWKRNDNRKIIRRYMSDPVFCKNEVEKDLEGVRDFFSVSDVLAKWP